MFGTFLIDSNDPPVISDLQMGSEREWVIKYVKVQIIRRLHGSLLVIFVSERLVIGRVVSAGL
jgi:hypothetical protein